MEALGLNLGYLLVQVLNFAIIFVVLRAWVYKPILGLLERRRMTIAQGLEDARVAAEARENAEEEARKIVNEAQTSAAQRVREATERAEAASQEVLSEAEANAVRVREVAARDAEQERERALGDLRGQVASLAMAAAQRLIGESMDETRQRKIIHDFFSGLNSNQLRALEGGNVAGASAEVTSALPLTEEEKDTVRQTVLSRLGSQSTLTFRVDPSILGGLVIRVGDKVMDGSVAGKLETMRQSLS